MAEHQLISTIKYVTATKPAFFLSEIIPYLDEPMPIQQLFSIISPELSALGLMAKKTNGDFEIMRIPPAQPYLMKQEELKQQQHFFTKQRTARFPCAKYRTIYHKKSRKGLERSDHYRTYPQGDRLPER